MALLLLASSLLLFTTVSSASFLAQPPKLHVRQDISTVVAYTTTVYQSSSTPPPSSSYTDTTALRESALNSRNLFRSQHNATDVVWNETLAEAAASWAHGCQWNHSGGPYGENLAQGFLDVTTATDAWGNERIAYDFGNPTGFSEETGHFTQLVWKSTSGVGCAAVDCDGTNKISGWFLVCEYSPPGNIVGNDDNYFEQNVQSKVLDAGPPPPSSSNHGVSSQTSPPTSSTSNGGVSSPTSSPATTAATASSMKGALGLGAASSGKKQHWLWPLLVSIAALGFAGTMV